MNTKRTIKIRKPEISDDHSAAVRVNVSSNGDSDGVDLTGAVALGGVGRADDRGLSGGMGLPDEMRGSLLMTLFCSRRSHNMQRISKVGEMMNLLLQKRRRSIVAFLFVIVIPVLSSCGSSNPLGGSPVSGDVMSITVGSADFPESKIVAEIYAQALETNNFTVKRQFSIGSREVYIPALRDHSIDLIPEYTGNLLQYFNPESTARTPDEIFLALFRLLPGDLAMLNPSRANDTDTIAVTESMAKKWGLTTIGDLAPYSSEITFAASSEFLYRTEGLPGLKAKYGFDVAPDNFVAISDGGGPATVRALLDGTVIAANIYSTSPSIRQHNLVILDDPQHNFLAANVFPLVNSRKKSVELKNILDTVSAKLTTEDLLDLNASVSGNSGLDPEEASHQWLRNNDLDQPIGVSSTSRSGNK